MSHANSRKVFIVVAGGNPSAERHFEDTIQRKRSLEEVRRFLPPRELENLEKIYHGSNFIVWGAVPGPMNESRWEKMTPGDVVLIYNNGRIRFAGEIAAKVRNKELARYFWRENDAGGTWELMYFIVNEERTDVPIEKLNPLFGYQAHYHPQGFSMINEEAVSTFAQNYGDILGVLKTLERGEELIHLSSRKEVLSAKIDERIERVPTEHDEMQWRLIRLGQLAKCDVWVPRNDQPKQYEGHQFRELRTSRIPRNVGRTPEHREYRRSLEIRAVLDKVGVRNRAFHFHLLGNPQTVRSQSRGTEFKLSSVYRCIRGQKKTGI